MQTERQTNEHTAMPESAAVEAARAARSRWPSVTISPRVVCEAMRRHYGDATPPSRFAGEDFALATAVAAGDQAAWSVFYSECHAFVQQVARRHCRNEGDAEEIAQDVVGEEAARRLKGYAGRCSLKGWLATITPNIVRDWHRRRAHEISVDPQPNREAGSPPAMDDRPGVTREESLENVEERVDRPYCETVLRESLRAGWERLKQAEQAILEYKFLHRLKNREIMLVFQLREDVVSKRLKKAIGRLGSQLRRYALTRFDCSAEVLRRCMELVVGRASLDALWAGGGEAAGKGAA